MDALIRLLLQSLDQVWGTFTHNWPFLLVSILVAVALKLYLDPQKVSTFLARNRRAGVVGATAAAVGTPLCSCGTTAIILGMMASTMPWAPIVAFMVASPLSSPEGLIYSAGLFGWPFALAYFGASIVLGLMGGAVAAVFESRGWLKNQARITGPQAIEGNGNPAPAQSACSSCSSASDRPAAQPSPALAVLSNIRPPSHLHALQLAPCCEVVAQPSAAPAVCGCGSAPSAAHTGARMDPPHHPAVGNRPRVTAPAFLNASLDTGSRLLLMFFGFAFIGYFLNGLIPAEWVAAIFGGGTVYSVPLAATLGLPLYINSEGALPLVRALIDNGMSQGAAMAFLITGSGTSLGAMLGALAIARWRVIALVIGVLWVGAILIGYLYNLYLVF